jgi:hypothetical protein
MTPQTGTYGCGPTGDQAEDQAADRDGPVRVLPGRGVLHQRPGPGGGLLDGSGEPGDGVQLGEQQHAADGGVLRDDDSELLAALPQPGGELEEEPDPGAVDVAGAAPSNSRVNSTLTASSPWPRTRSTTPRPSTIRIAWFAGVAAPVPAAVGSAVLPGSPLFVSGVATSVAVIPVSSRSRPRTLRTLPRAIAAQGDTVAVSTAALSKPVYERTREPRPPGLRSACHLPVGSGVGRRGPAAH